MSHDMQVSKVGSHDLSKSIRFARQFRIGKLRLLGWGIKYRQQWPGSVLRGFYPLVILHEDRALTGKKKVPPYSETFSMWLK
jgi:hypothetical protein